jgi:hypothetical protein
LRTEQKKSYGILFAVKKHIKGIFGRVSEEGRFLDWTTDLFQI